MSTAGYLGQPLRGCLLLAAVVSAMTTASPASVAAPVLDALATCPPPGPPGGNVVTFGTPDLPPIPPDFFDPGSDPFVGPVSFEGIALDSIVTGNASTIIQRSGDPVQPNQPPGAFGQVPMEIHELSLVSIDPITVTYGGVNPQLWDFSVTLSNIQAPPGQIIAQKTHPNGGVFSAFFPVQAVFTFVNRDTFIERTIDTGQLGFPPIMLQISGASFVHNVNPDLQLILPLPGSSWVPGVLEQVPGNPDSQVIVPFTANSSGRGVSHTVCPGGVKEGRCEVVSKTISYSTECATGTNPDGTKYAQLTFTMDASFRDNAPCCEYRQYVKGSFTRNGQKVPKALGPGIVLDPNVFQEDGVGGPVPAGTNPHYGHRNEPKNPAGDRYSNPANRKAGDTYHGSDAPGFPRIKAGRTYSFNLTFKGVIIDTCNQLSMEPHEWPASCSGTASGTPVDPLMEVLIETTINGRLAILGVYRYPGAILTVVASISNGIGAVPIDAAEVDIAVKGLAVIDAPDPGALDETMTNYVSSHAFYDFDYPPGSPNPVHVAFTYGPETQEFDVVVTTPCPADLDGDGSVGIVDFLALLAAWGPCTGPCPPSCPADFDGDCSVGIVDFLTLLAAWGPCPP